MNFAGYGHEGKNPHTWSPRLFASHASLSELTEIEISYYALSFALLKFLSQFNAFVRYHVRFKVFLTRKWVQPYMEEQAHQDFLTGKGLR